MHTSAVALPILAGIVQASSDCNAYCAGKFGSQSIGYVMGTAPFCGADCNDCLSGDVCGISSIEFNDGGHPCVTGSKQCCCSRTSQMETVASNVTSETGLKMDEIVAPITETAEMKLEMEETVAAANCDSFCASKGIKYGYVRGTAPFCGAGPGDCCAHDWPGMQSTSFSDGGASCATGTKQCCCGTPAGQSGCPKPGPSDLSCNVISGVCNIIVKEATSTEACTELAAKAAGLCLAVGLGPEDPWADACAVVIATTIEVACTQAIKQVGKFVAGECTKAAGCAASSTLLSNATFDTSILV